MMSLLLLLLAAIIKADNIYVRKPFPDIEVHMLELQKYNMAEYFYGTSLEYELVHPKPSENTYFRTSKTLCHYEFKGGNITHAFVLDPLTDDMPQILLTLSSNLILTRYTMNDSCNPLVNSLHINASIDFGLEGVKPVSVFAFYEGQSHFYVMVEVAVCYFLGYRNYIYLVKWPLDLNIKPEVHEAEDAGPLTNATLLSYDDMLFAYQKCRERKDCPNGNSVYGYLLRLDRGLWDMDPYLIAKLDGNFFRREKAIFRDVAQYNNSLLLCDIEGNVIYQVRISSADRIPVLVRRGQFVSRVDAISVPKTVDNLFYVTAKLSPKGNAEILKIQNSSLSDMYYDYSKPFPPESLLTSEFYIEKACNTLNFHITHIKTTKNNSYNIIRTVSLDNQYYNVTYMNDIIFLDCYLYRYDYILIIKPQGYYLYKYQFPELVINYTGSTQKHMPHFPLNDTISFVVKSSTDKIPINKQITIYAENDIYPTLYCKEDQTFQLYHYKGMIRTMDLSSMYGGIVSTIYPTFENPALKSIISVEPKWIELKPIITANVTKYNKLLQSADEKSLVIATINDKVHAFAFTAEVIKELEKMHVYCFDISLGKELVECDDKFELDGLKIDTEIVGPVVQISSRNYATVRKQEKRPGEKYDHYYLELYQYDPDINKTVVLKKIVTEAFKPGDEVQSLIYNEKGNPKTLIVYGTTKDNTGFFRIFALSYEKGKFGVKKGKRHITDHRIIKAAFLQESDAAVFLCANSTTRYLLVHAFAELPMPTKILPLEGSVIDFLPYQNHIIAVTENGFVFQWSLDYPDLVLDRLIPLPVNTYLIRDNNNNKTVINIEKEMIGKRLFLYILLYVPLITESPYQLYVYDVMDITHKAPFMLIPIGKNVISDTTEIYGIYSTKYKEESLVMLLTNETILSYLVRDQIALKFNGVHQLNVVNEKITIRTYDSSYHWFNINLTEMNTSIVAFTYTNEDKLVSLPEEMTLSLDTYVKGYGVNYAVKDEGEAACNSKPEIVGGFQELDRLYYGYNESFYLILSNNKFFVYTTRNTMYYYELNYDQANNKIFPTPKQIYHSSCCITPSGIKVLHKNKDAFYCAFLGTSRTLYLPSLAIYNSSLNLVFETQVTSGENAMLLASDTLGVFAYIHVMHNSFFGKVVIPFNTSVLAYDFTSYDIGEGPVNILVCAISQVYPYLYCVDSKGRIHAIRLYSERASLSSITDLSKGFKKLLLTDTTVKISDVTMHATHTNELFINFKVGMLRCKCGTLNSHSIDCFRSEDPHVLNMVPNYRSYSPTRIWATDGKVIANLARSSENSRHYSIRLINVLSPFDNTEVVDVPLEYGNKVISIALNSTAFGQSGIMFVEYHTLGLIAYKFTFSKLLKLKNTKNYCKVSIAATDAFGKEMEINLEIKSVQQITKINVSVIFGGFLCMAGYAIVIALTLHYMKKDSKKEHRSKTEEDSESESEVSERIEKESKEDSIVQDKVDPDFKVLSLNSESFLKVEEEHNETMLIGGRINLSELRRDIDTEVEESKNQQLIIIIDLLNQFVRHIFFHPAQTINNYITIQK
eukprot:TRINITY_DN318_c0_g1_i2.p1 TRINITY_DN318_c0_g1~~TRINITY_DN318_c0_g1_i2.p1  ORF type:complete len:1557 (+),score=147.45 TRINITY_DN318_c0_g1_i2:3645-8315(+)